MAKFNFNSPQFYPSGITVQIDETLSIKVVPGVNRIDDESYEIFKEHPDYKAFIDFGMLAEMADDPDDENFDYDPVVATTEDEDEEDEDEE